MSTGDPGMQQGISGIFLPVFAADK